MAPEVFKGEEYSSKCDVWSLGVMLYECLFGRPPWNSKIGENDLFKNIFHEPLVIPEIPKIKESTKSLIKSMLEINQDKRISFPEILKHNSFDEKKPVSQIQESDLNRLKKSLDKNLELVNKFPLVQNCYLNKKPTIESEKKPLEEEVMKSPPENKFYKLLKKNSCVTIAEDYVGFYLNVARFLRKVIHDIHKNEDSLKPIKKQIRRLFFYLLFLKKSELIILNSIIEMIKSNTINEFLTKDFYEFKDEKKLILSDLEKNFNDSFEIFEDMLMQETEFLNKKYFSKVFGMKENEAFLKKQKKEFENLTMILREKFNIRTSKNKLLKLMVEIKICTSIDNIFNFFHFDKNAQNSDQFYQFYEDLKTPECFEDFLREN